MFAFSVLPDSPLYRQTELTELLVRGEGQNIDFKCPHQRFQHLPLEQKASLLKDVMAFSNTLQGGYLILGIADSEPYPQSVVGLSEAVADSYEITRIHDLLQHYADPVPVFSVHQIVHLGALLVIVEIEEFRTIPHICQKDLGSILHAGEIYIRTKGAQTRRIRRSTEMRQLIHRATLRHQQELVSFMTDLVIPSSERG